MKTVITFGTFDVVHKGHESYLKQAKELGDYLITVVARDEVALKIKKQKPQSSEQERLEEIRESGLVDEVVLGNLEDKYKVLEKYRPDVIALGYDQRVDLEELKIKLKEFKLNSKIIRLKAYQSEVYKSSKIKKVYGRNS